MNFKKILVLFFFIYCFQTYSIADDIKDFEIEGISVGDSLLRYYSKDEIKKKEKSYYPKSKKFYRIHFLSNKSHFDGFQFQLIEGDRDFILHGIAKIILYENNIKDCFDFKKNKVVPEVKSIFENVEIENQKKPHTYDPSGDSIADVTWFNIDRGQIIVSCTDWSEQVGFTDKLAIKANSEQLTYFIENEAY